MLKVQRVNFSLVCGYLQRHLDTIRLRNLAALTLSHSANMMALTGRFRTQLRVYNATTSRRELESHPTSFNLTACKIPLYLTLNLPYKHNLHECFAMSTTSDRPVFLTRWGSTPSSSKSFHHCILVADSSQLTVTSATTGTTFDWGSAAPGGGWMKIRNPSKVKPFNAEAYAKGAICRNTYEYIGTTDWDNARIEQLSPFPFLPVSTCVELTLTLAYSEH
jgi:hypothetical protein